MICRNAAMEVILGIARTTTTRFKMQGRGYLAPQHYTSLAEKMGEPVPTVKKWFNQERMPKGRAGNFHTTPKRKGKPPAVEVRSHLPLTRGKAPSATYIQETKGEYFKDDTPQKVEMDVLWPPCLESLTMHSFESEDT